MLPIAIVQAVITMITEIVKYNRELFEALPPSEKSAKAVSEYTKMAKWDKFVDMIFGPFEKTIQALMSANQPATKEDKK